MPRIVCPANDVKPVCPAPLKRIVGLVAVGLLATTRLPALDEAPYAVAEKPWPEGLGNHRAVLRVEKKADAIVTRIPWRRRDRDPERKDIIVMDAATGLRVTNVARLSDDRFEGVLAFQPQTVPGDYFVYYLPYPPQKGWGSYTLDYFKQKDTADPEWKTKVAPASSPAALALPSAKVLRLEARTEFDSFYPMEVVATPEEVQAMLDKVGQASRLSLTSKMETGGTPVLLFPEDRRFPIRMKDELPLRWVKSGPTNVFRGKAQRNEFYVFQIGVWAARTNLAGLDVEFSGKIAKWLRCFNTGGTNWDAQPFHKTLAVPQGRVQALWFGVDVPPDAKPGVHHATVTLRPTNAPASSVELVLTVLPTELADRGDGDLWRLARLRWLDSILGSDQETVDPYQQIAAESLGKGGWCFTLAAGSGRETHALRRELEMTAVGIWSIKCGGSELLQGPLDVFAKSLNDINSEIGPTRTRAGSGVESLKTVGVGASFDEIRDISVESDGSTHMRLGLRGKRLAKITGVRLHIPLCPEIATYFMGLGLRACPTPTNFTWHWTGPYNSFWVGNAQAGLQVKLLGSTYEGPMQNLYHPKPPPSWFNEGKGGVTVTRGASNEVSIQIFTGPFELKAGEERTFEFSLLVTPVKPLDPATHFRERYWHATGTIPDSANVINVHHATVPNPFINYPFLALDKLREFTHTQQARGKKVKIYYTVRELTSRLPELWALRSLGDEVLAGGPGGGYPWLREHLGGDYTPQWYTQVEGGQVDAAILTSGASRWYNFYVEGLNWLVRNVPIDGVYLDDVAFDRTILKRMRKVMDRARPGCLIDLHSNTAFSRGPAVQYTEFFPYVDRLWFGESFDYDAMTPEQWLVECSGIPFGLMGDMLQGGGNRWRGMVFGMTVRPPWVTDGVSCNPDAIWKLWDDFGIADAKMIGWWEKDCPVRTDRDDVLATAYVRKGKALIALASWAKEKTDVRLELDWKALGLDAAKAKLVAPEVKDFQPACEWHVGEPISVEPKRGWLISVTE